MTGDEYLLAALGAHGVQARFLGLRQNLDLRHRLHILPADRRVTGVGHIKHIVKTTQQNGILVDHLVGEHTEHFLVQCHLVDTEVIVQGSLRAPADVEGAVDMGFGPLHDPAQFLPVGHFLEGQKFHRRAGDDHAVIILVLNLVERLIERQHVLLGSILGLVAADLHQLQFHLQRRVAQQTGKLCLGNDLGGHQVQQRDAQRTNLLRPGPGLGHDEDIFVFQDLPGREGIGYLNGHIGFLALDEIRSVPEPAAGRQ